MAKRVTSVSTPTAHLIGPGKLKVINQRLAFSTGQGTPTRLDPASLRTLICYGKVGITDDAFAMFQASFAVENGQIKPTEIRFKSGRPDHGAEAFASKADLQPWKNQLPPG